MYFVDRKTIEEKLSLMDQYLHFFTTKSEWTTFSDKLSLERIVHIIIESIIDVGNSMIDGFIMRDPGSYEDIIDILLDEKVIEEKDAAGLKNLISLRAMVVRNYTNIDHELIEKLVKDHYDTIKNYSPCIRQYLKNELGHVTAFIPE